MKLVDPYLSAAKLGINDETRETLKWLAGELVLGRISHGDFDGSAAIADALRNRPLPYPTAFNMAIVRCGTVGCIKRWLEAIGPLSDEELFALDDLFYPHPHLFDHRSITPERAGREILWWLSTGKAWGAGR